MPEEKKIKIFDQDIPLIDACITNKSKDICIDLLQEDILTINDLIFYKTIIGNYTLLKCKCTKEDYENLEKETEQYISAHNNKMSEKFITYSQEYKVTSSTRLLRATKAYRYFIRFLFIQNLDIIQPYIDTLINYYPKNLRAETIVFVIHYYFANNFFPMLKIYSCELENNSNLRLWYELEGYTDKPRKLHKIIADTGYSLDHVKWIKKTGFKYNYYAAHSHSINYYDIYEKEKTYWQHYYNQNILLKKDILKLLTNEKANLDVGCAAYMIQHMTDYKILSFRIPGDKHSTRNELALIKPDILNQFDVSSFINSIIKAVCKKRKYSLDLSLPNNCKKYYKLKKTSKEDLKTINKIVKEIINNILDVKIEGNCIHLPANRKKGLGGYAFDVIEKAGKQMSLDDIYKELCGQVSTRPNKDSLRSAILRHKGLMSVGKSGYYALKQWKICSHLDIRGLITRYLGKFDHPVQIEQIVKYVSKYHKTTAYSILNSINLSIRKKENRFLYFGNKMYGLASIKYPECYVSVDLKHKVDATTRIEQIIDFIKANKRMPRRNSKNLEENQLYNWCINNRYIKSDKISEAMRNNDIKTKIKGNLF